MALTKVTYTDDVTVIEAQNLNNIQDEIISLETVNLVAVNSDLDTIQTPGRYRLWGAYTNSPTTNDIYGVLTVSGIPGALIQMYQSCTATNSFFRGYTNSQWYPWKQLMINSGGTFNGNVYINRADGTTSATGTSTLWLGNNTPTGTAGNSKGQVVIYGNGANYVNIQATYATGNRTVELPDTNGTLTVNQTGVWSPQLYDYETSKLTLTNAGEYIRIGSLAVFSFNVRIDTAVTFNTMMQVRGFPFSVRIFGGSLYSAGAANSFADRTIQYAGNAVYVRPNFTGTVASGAWWSGMFIGIVA